MDHYPFSEPERANQIASAALALGVPPELISVPPHADPAPVAPPPSRFVRRSGYLVCVDCGLVIDYCACGPRAPAVPSQDGATANLDRRIAEARDRAVLARQSVPWGGGWRSYCGGCGRLIEDCQADRGGCRS
jgi:hypothetical protein